MPHIAVPTEIKPNEARIALTPEACKALVEAGHTVHIQAGAGEKAGWPDADYEAVGCVIEADAAALYGSAHIIIKVKEPLDGDLAHLTKDHTLFCYLHLASAPALVEKLKSIGCTAVAFETVVVDGKTPLLAPMSAIAGRLAVQIGTWHLHLPRGGRGVLLGGFIGQSAGRVTVVGAGISGTEAAVLAHNMGAKVRVLDINGERLQQLSGEYPDMEMIVSTPQALEEVLPETDLLVGSVYVVGRKAPTVVTRAQVQTMPKGAVVVDISIDQGGCIETSRPCTHDEPVYEEEGLLHSAITNMPAAAPHTASEALSHAILPYVQQLAEDDWSEELTGGINVQASQLKIAL